MGILYKNTIQTYVPEVSGRFKNFRSAETTYKATKETTTVCEWVTLPYHTTDTDTAGTRRTATRVKLCSQVTTTDYYYSTRAGGGVYIEPVPAHVLTDYQIGWNARAQSSMTLGTAGELLFTMPGSVAGAIIGLTERPQSSGFADIRFGFRQVGTMVEVMELGQVVATVGSRPGANYSIRRTVGKIEYRVNDVLVRTTNDYAVAMFASAAFYSGGDSVIDAQFESFASAVLDGVMPAATGIFSDSAAFAFLAGVMPAASGSFVAENQANLYGFMPAASGIFSDVAGYAFLDASAPAPGGLFDALGTVPFASLVGMVPPPDGIFTCLNGSVGSLNGTCRAASGLFSAGAYSDMVAYVPAADGFFEALVGADEALIAEFMQAGVAMTGTTQAFAVLDISMRLVGLMTLNTQHLASLDMQMGASVGMNTTQIIQAMLASLMDASVGMGRGDPLTVWALHMDAGGSTRYENYDYNSFGELDGVYYGLKEDGLYELDGLDDAGVPVDASVNFGHTSFGTLSRKAMPFVYAGVSSNGNLILRVVADGKTYHYNMRHNTEDMKAHRFELGKGLRASFYDVTLINEGGSAFDLSSIDFQPIELSRSL